MEKEKTPSKQTPARQRATAKYQQKCYMFTVKLTPIADADIIGKLEEQENRQGYIKTLIRKDIENGKH